MLLGRPLDLLHGRTISASVFDYCELVIVFSVALSCNLSSNRVHLN